MRRAASGVPRCGVVLLLAACGARPDPVEVGFTPSLAHVDRDGDGRLDPSEYGRVALAAPPFAEVDGDGDGSIGPAEIAALIRTSDPVYFDHRQTFGATGTLALAGQSSREMDAAAREVRDLLRFEAEEIVAKGGTAPDPQAITAAAQTGRLDSPESRAVLVQLHAEASRLGLAWPDGIDGP